MHVMSSWIMERHAAVAWHGALAVGCSDPGSHTRACRGMACSLACRSMPPASRICRSYSWQWLQVERGGVCVA